MRVNGMGREWELQLGLPVFIERRVNDLQGHLDLLLDRSEEGRLGLLLDEAVDPALKILGESTQAGAGAI